MFQFLHEYKTEGRDRSESPWRLNCEETDINVL